MRKATVVALIVPALTFAACSSGAGSHPASEYGGYYDPFPRMLTHR